MNISGYKYINFNEKNISITNSNVILSPIVCDQMEEKYVESIKNSKILIKSFDSSNAIFTNLIEDLMKALLVHKDTLRFIKFHGTCFNDININTINILEKIIIESNLEEISLTQCYITPTVLKLLSRSIILSKTLEYVNLSGNINIGNEGVPYLSNLIKRNSTLTHINLSQCSISDLGLKGIADSFEYNKTLKALDLGNNVINHKITDYLAKKFYESTDMMYLNIQNCEIYDNKQKEYLKKTFHENYEKKLDF